MTASYLWLARSSRKSTPANFTEQGDIEVVQVDSASPLLSIILKVLALTNRVLPGCHACFLMPTRTASSSAARFSCRWRSCYTNPVNFKICESFYDDKTSARGRRKGAISRTGGYVYRSLRPSGPVRTATRRPSSDLTSTGATAPKRTNGRRKNGKSDRTAAEDEAADPDRW